MSLTEPVSPPTVDTKLAKRGSGPLRLLGELSRVPSAGIILATVVLVLVIGISHHRFFRLVQMIDILQGSTYVGFLAIGMAFLIAMREIDLSVGSLLGLSVICGALLINHGWNPWLAMVGGVVVGGILGGVNAILVTVIRIPTIVATLATLSVYRGLTIGFTNGQPITFQPDVLKSKFFSVIAGRVGPFPFIGRIPLSVIVLAICAAVFSVVMHRTKFGYRVLALGSNPDAAEFAGISLRRVRTQCLILVGVLGGIGAMFALAYFSSADPNVGTGFELSAIAAAIIGGTPLRGGSGTVVGAVVGSVLLSVVVSGLTYFNITATWSAFATGIIILVAVGIDSLFRGRRGRTAQPSIAL